MLILVIPTNSSAHAAIVMHPHPVLHRTANLIHTDVSCLSAPSPPCFPRIARPPVLAHLLISSHRFVSSRLLISSWWLLSSQWLTSSQLPAAASL